MIRAAPCVAAVACGVALCGCGGVGDWCVDRGKQTTYAGALQYGGQLDDAGSASGSIAGGTPMDITIDDLSAQDDNHTSDPGSCGAAFTVRVSQACVLWGYPQSFQYDTGKYASGDFISAQVDVSADGPCTLALAEGSVVLAVRSGSLELTPGRATLTFDGTVQSVDGATRGGYVSVMYASE